MSFSSKVKEELSKTENLTNKENVKHELIGYLLSSNTSIIKNKIKFSTESEYNINRLGKLLSNCKILDYKIEIQEPLEKENFKEETIAILGLIYRDFLASPDEREELQLRDAEELKKIEEKIQKQYDVENIFEKRKSVAKTELTVYKEPGVIKKLFNLIKGIFKKNKF